MRLARLEPEIYVLHDTGALATEFSRVIALQAMRPMVLNLFVAHVRLSIEQLLERTGLPSRLVAVEAIEFPFDLTLGVAEDLDLSMCVDT